MEKIVRKFRSFEEADNADYEYYRTLSGNEKLQLLLDLIMPENQMRPLSSDLREFIHLLNTNSVKYVIVGAPGRSHSMGDHGIQAISISLFPETTRTLTN
jgi:hypothetical protein